MAEIETMSGPGRFQSLAEIEPEPVRWLWEGRIPFGKVTVLEGDPGVGKSTLALDIAARVSRGQALPPSRDGHPDAAPASVLIHSGDDGLADTVSPRLMAAGADLKKVWAFGHPLDVADLGAIRPALIILDPFASYASLTPEESPVQVMRSLGQLAQATGAAVLAIQCEAEGGRNQAAADYLGHPRSVLALSLVGHGGRKLILSKSNLRSTAEVHPLVFHIDEENGASYAVGWSDGR